MSMCTKCYSVDLSNRQAASGLLCKMNSISGCTGERGYYNSKFCSSKCKNSVSSITWCDNCDMDRVDGRLFCSTCWKLDLKICQYCNERKARSGTQCWNCSAIPTKKKNKVGIPEWFLTKKRNASK